MSNTLLVTTGLNFKPMENEKILFAGDWCYCREPERQNFPGSETLEYPFDSAAVELANNEINEVYGQLLANLTEVFNHEFNLNKDIRYYRIVFGLWLYHFLHGIYEKRRIIQAAIGHYGRVRVETCGRSAYIAPDSNSYNLISYGSHEFNFRQYSSILEHFNDVEKTYVCRDNEFEKALPGAPSFRIALRGILQEAMSMTAKAVHGRMTTVTSPNYSRGALSNVINLFIRSECRIVHINPSPGLQNGLIEADCILRERLRGLLMLKCGVSASQLEGIAADLLLDFMPAVLVEGFGGLRNAAIKWKRAHAEIDSFFTCNGMHTDDFFKLIVAETPDASLGISQHGAGYGFLNIMIAEEYERLLADRYYTWGWGDRTLPHPKLLKEAEADYINNSEVLFTFPTIPVYAGLLQSYYIASQYEAAMRKTSIFLKTVPETLRGNIILRQRVIKGFRLYHPPMDVRNDTALRFSDSLFRSRIHVSNHLGTPAIESLAMEHPTVILYNPEYEALRAEAKPYFDRLRKVGILFDDPVLAARHLESIYHSPDDWWLRSEVQSALKAFNFRYARVDRHWSEVWLKELLDLNRKE